MVLVLLPLQSHSLFDEVDAPKTDAALQPVGSAPATATPFGATSNDYVELQVEDIALVERSNTATAPVATDASGYENQAAAWNVDERLSSLQRQQQQQQEQEQQAVTVTAAAFD
jgi:hypothetical protein